MKVKIELKFLFLQMLIMFIQSDFLANDSNFKVHPIYDIPSIIRPRQCCILVTNK